MVNTEVRLIIFFASKDGEALYSQQKHYQEKKLYTHQEERGNNVHQHAAAAAAKSLQLCPTLCDPIDGSPPASPVPGILQARTLEWVAISFSIHESEKRK